MPRLKAWKQCGNIYLLELFNYNLLEYLQLWILYAQQRKYFAAKATLSKCTGLVKELEMPVTVCKPHRHTLETLSYNTQVHTQPFSDLGHVSSLRLRHCDFPLLLLESAVRTYILRKVQNLAKFLWIFFSYPKLFSLSHSQLIQQQCFYDSSCVNLSEAFKLG